MSHDKDRGGKPQCAYHAITSEAEAKILREMEEANWAGSAKPWGEFIIGGISPTDPPYIETVNPEY